MFDYIFYGTHFCRYALFFCFKLALDVTTTIKIVCMHTIMHFISIHIHMETILTKYSRTWHFICLISKKGYACTWASLSVFLLCPRCSSCYYLCVCDVLLGVIVPCCEVRCDSTTNYMQRCTEHCVWNRNGLHNTELSHLIGHHTHTNNNKMSTSEDSGAHHTLCFVVVLFVFSLCILCCQFLLIVHSVFYNVYAHLSTTSSKGTAFLWLFCIFCYLA
jgi:hypothetical protein